MTHFGLKITKSESPDKTPYTVYYPHSKSIKERNWTEDYYQVVSIDPARKNYGFRIERRYKNGKIIPIFFEKVHIENIKEDDNIIICNTYQTLTQFLDQYKEEYFKCHFIVIERQLPQNYKASRIAQHTISYFSLLLHNSPLLPAIVEVNPQLKGKMLDAPSYMTDKQLKKWAVIVARKLLKIRGDEHSLKIMDKHKNKQDDLADTICQVEALFICWQLNPITPLPEEQDPILSILQSASKSEHFSTLQKFLSLQNI